MPFSMEKRSVGGPPVSWIIYQNHTGYSHAPENIQGQEAFVSIHVVCWHIEVKDACES